MKAVVGFSGGADSQATALWVRQGFPPENVILLNTQAGRNEHPLTVEFIRWYSENVFPVVEVVPLVKDLNGKEPGMVEKLGLNPDDELTFELLAKVKQRFPMGTARFCTTFLKLYPQVRWCRQNLAGKGICFERYIGVRRDESYTRANALAKQWDDLFDTYLHRPLLDWSKEQVFAFLAEHGEEVNPLYRMGFGRVGCAPCIVANKDDIRNWAARFPEMIDKVRAWEQSVGRTFFAPMVPGLEINWVDQVVEWSKTERGGRQLTLPFFEAEAQGGGCVSKYGLCE